MREHSFHPGWRKVKIGAALAVGLGLLAVPTAMPVSADENVSTSADADTTIAGTAFAGFASNDPAALLTFDSNIGVVLRKPELAATEAEADARNTAGPEPTIICHEGVTTTAPAAIASSKTVAGVGRYASEDGNLILYFYMEDAPSSAVDVCVMENSDYVSGAGKFVFTAAGAKAAYGDPTVLVEAAKAELTKVKTAAAKLYKKSGAFAPTNTLRTQLRKELNNQKIFIRAAGQLVNSVNNAHLIREEMTSSKLVASVRTADTRLVTMTYDAAKNKTSFKVTPETFDSGAKAPTSTTTKKGEVTAQGISKPKVKYYVPNGFTLATSGAVVSGYGTNDVYVAVKADNGGFVLPEAARKNLRLPFGYTWTELNEIAFIGKSEAVNAALATLQFFPFDQAYSPKDTRTATISITAFEYRSDVAYNPNNQHFYKFVSYGGEIRANNTDATIAPKEDRTAVKAEAAANAMTEYGLTGYLATITDGEENAFVATKIANQSTGLVVSNVWINGSDSETEGVWKFTAGPEKGRNFWNGCGEKATPAGSAPAGAYARWNTPDKEPNNYLANGDTCEQAGQAGKQATAGEDCMVTNWSRPWIATDYRVGYWNDLACDSPNDSIHVQGYVVEFGNKAVGGDYTGIDTTSVTLTVAPPKAKSMAANFFKKAATFTKNLLTPKPFKAPASLKKKHPKVSNFVTVEARLTAAEPGQYEMSVTNSRNRYRIYKTFVGSSVKPDGAKPVTEKQDKFFRRFTTTKPNQRVGMRLILDRRLVENSGAKVADVAVEVRLVNPSGLPVNMSSLAGQTTLVPVTIISK